MAETPGTIHSVTEGGITADHIEVPLPQAFVAATNSEKEHNTIKPALIPFACFRADDMRFEFESSFVLPGIATEYDALKDLIDRNTLTDEQRTKHKPILTVFGHADPTGNDDFNKALSGRRAQAIYGMLTRRTDLWEELFNNPADHWGKPALGTMLDTVSSAASNSPSTTGAPSAGSGKPDDGQDSTADKEREKQINKLQRDPGGRKKLFKSYMDVVCASEVFRLEAADQTRLQNQGVAIAGRLTGLLGQEFGKEKDFLQAVEAVAGVDETARNKRALLREAKKTKPFVVEPEDFLAGGKDKAGGKGDYQGCGEFNPVFLQSQKDIDEFEQAPASSPEKAKAKLARDAANKPDRRVLIFLFRPGVRINPEAWPCPRAKEGTEGCRKRFFSDGDKRRNTHLPDKPRKFEETKDTFACRFYDRLSNNSPCEQLAENGICFVFLKLMDDEGLNPLANRKYILRGRQTRRTINGVSRSDGVIRHEFLPDDYFELESNNSTEFVPVYYMSEKEEFEGRPWFLRFRDDVSGGPSPGNPGS